MFPQFGLSSSDRIGAAKIANMVRRENDLLVARLYGLDKADLEVMPAGFKVLNTKEPGYGAA